MSVVGWISRLRDSLGDEFHYDGNPAGMVGESIRYFRESILFAGL